MGRDARYPGGIGLERALKSLVDRGPLIKFDVTATLLAIFLMLRRKMDAGLGNELRRITADDIIYIQPDGEYVGTEAFVALTHNGRDLYLGPNELNNRNDFMTRKVETMYADAARYQRSLLLDVTSPAVTAAGNIYVKAAKLLQLHPHAVAIVVSGREIMCQAGSTAQPRSGLPQDGKYSLAWYRRKQASTGRARSFQTVLTQYDLDFPTTPIFVFGYSQLQRGISYRSSDRVPSHMVLQFGKAMSLCRLVQAAGRANGKQAEKLCENMGYPMGEAKVKLLTNARDFDAIRNYPAFLEKIRRVMLEGGLNLEEALELRYDGRFAAIGNRPVGALRARLAMTEAPLLFSEVRDEELALHLPGERYLSTRLPGLMQCLLDILSAGPGVVDPAEGMTVAEIMTELEATYSYYELLMDRETREEMSSLDRTQRAARVRPVLEEMLRTRVGVSPLIDKAERPVRYAITERGVRILELRVMADERGSSNASPAPPSLSRQSSLARYPAHLERVEFEEADMEHQEEEGNQAATPQQYAFVPAYPDLNPPMWVMLGCLGRVKPQRFSRIFCPLIFLAANPRHEGYSEAMNFYRARLSHWDEFVTTVRMSLGEDESIAQDESVCALMYDLPGSRLISHYTAVEQIRVLTNAGISAKVDACVQATFDGQADQAAADQAAADQAGGPPPPEAAGPSAPTYRSCGAPTYRSTGAPTYRSCGASGAATEASASGAEADDDDDNDDSWWATIM